MKVIPANPIMVSEDAETLRRCSSKPDTYSGWLNKERAERRYEPLVKLGLLTKSVRPHPTRKRVEIVLFEATDLGLSMLAAYDRANARAAQ